MLEYKSKYFTKALSVYGEPNLTILKKIKEYTHLDRNSSILIPNCQDGIYVLPFAKISKNIVCYEENEILLNGGIIDNFSSLGLYNRLKGSKLDDNVKIHNYNFYEEKNHEQYDFVLAVRTIQLEENNKYTIKEKLQRLLSSVKDNGFLYLNYYIDEDDEVKESQIIRYNEIKNNIDLKEWNILYYRDNFKRYTYHNSHPQNIGKHKHKIGSILIQKQPYIYNKRILERTYKAGSIYGNPNQQVYDYIDFLKKKINNKANVLIVDANDGKNAIPFIKNDFNVVCYENDEILLNGGMYENKKTQGLKKRIADCSSENNVIVKELNFYEVKEIKKYDFVYADSSLNLPKNSEIPMKRKVRKLMSSVKEGGYLYIYYDLTLDEKKNPQIHI